MAQRFNDDFKREVVRTFQTSGLPQRQVAADFGIGLSTIGKWLVKFGAQTGMNQAQLEQQKEIACLARAQNRSGGEGCVKKGNHLLCGAKAMRFAFINSYREALSQTHLCRIFARRDNAWIACLARATFERACTRRYDPFRTYSRASETLQFQLWAHSNGHGTQGVGFSVSGAYRG